MILSKADRLLFMLSSLVSDYYHRFVHILSTTNCYAAAISGFLYLLVVCSLNE